MRFALAAFLLALPAAAHAADAVPTPEPTADKGPNPPVVSGTTSRESPAPDAAAPAPRAPNPPPDGVTSPTTPPTTTRPSPRSPTAGPQIEGPRDGVADCRPGAAACVRGDHFALWPRLRIRSGRRMMQADSQLLTVGHYDGFFLDQTRIGLDGAYRDDLRFRLIIDVVSLLPGAAQNAPVNAITASVRDAWVGWMPSDWFFASVGQQFMPGDVEGTTTIAALPFTQRSVLSSGVRAGTGTALPGLSPTRQVGIVLGSTELARVGPVALEYLVGVGNGNGQNFLGNDNKLPAAYARFGAGYIAGEDAVRVGVGGRYNPRTVGTLPNLFHETDVVGFADISARFFGLGLVAVGQIRQTSFDTVIPDPANPAGSETGMGAAAWVYADRPFGADLFGLIPAYRIAWYDASSAFVDDTLLENTIALRWNIPLQGLPLSAIVDGTLLTEMGDSARDLENARATFLLQLEL